MADKTLTIQIVTDTDRATAGIDQVSKKTEGMGAAFKNAAALAATFLAGKALSAVGQFVGDSVRAYSDLNESLNAVGVQYGESAEGILKLGENAAQSIGASNAEFNQYAVSISAFAQQIAGDGGDIVGTVDTLSKRTADFASVMNLDFGEAAEKFRSGLAGESEPLRQFGIDVSAAKVEQVALTEGIWDGVDAMTESEKVQARFAAIMEQTAQVQGDFAATADDYANAQRIANAEMENAKARAGEAMVPVAQLGSELKLVAAEGLGVFASALQAAFGQISEVDAAIQQFTIMTGRQADSAAAALTIAKEWEASFAELIPRLSLGTDALTELRDADDELLKSFGFNEEQIKELRKAVDDDLSKSMSESADRVLRGKMIPAQEDLASATHEARKAFEEQADAQRAAADPMFKAIRLADDAAAAQDAYNKAIEEYGEDSKEARDAAVDLAETNLDLQDTFQELKAQGIDPTGAAARNMFRRTGMTDAQIDAIFDQFDKIEDDMESRDIRIPVSVPNLRPMPTGDGGVGWSSPSREHFQHGGIVTGPTEALIGEAGSDEAVVPLNSEGARFMARTFVEALGMMKPAQQSAPVFNVTIHAGIGADVREIERAVLKVVRDADRKWRQR